MDGTISFDGNSLQTYNPTTGIGIITDDFDLDSPAEKTLSVYPLANADDMVIAGSESPSKIFPLSGTLKADTPTNLDNLMDTFKGYFNKENGNLDAAYGGSTRRYIATENGLKFTRLPKRNAVRYNLIFICKPYGVNTTATTALNVTGRTANSYSDSHTFIGSAPYQQPIATITLTAVSSTGSQQLFWGNNDTGQNIAITRSNWTPGDIIVIDTRFGGSITVNGVPTDFAGAFPEFSKGAHPMVYGDTFTTRTFSESVIYYPRWR